MASAAQIATNRRNALRSTGPRTAAGKARSRRNAHKHGLYSRAEPPPPEDAAQIDRLTADCRQRLHPADQIEEVLVRRLALTQFRLSRIRILEATLLNSGLAKAKRHRQDLQLAIGRAVGDCAGALEKLSRYEARLDRHLDLTLEILLTRQRHRKSGGTNPIATASRKRSCKPPAAAPSKTRSTWRRHSCLQRRHSCRRLDPGAHPGALPHERSHLLVRQAIVLIVPDLFRAAFGGQMIVVRPDHQLVRQCTANAEALPHVRKELS